MRSLAIVLCAFGINAAAMLAACGASQPPLAPGATSDTGGHALPHHETFHYTGKKQLFTVPLFVTRITAVALGAAGGGYPVSRGGRVYAVVPVTGGETLSIFVGGVGALAKGGFNGGADGGQSPYCRSCPGYGGGGESDIREGGHALFNRILIAGGGGGQGGFESSGYGVGGKGGGVVGGTGNDGYGISDPGGGSGGTQYGGGSGGKGGEGGSGQGDAGVAGSLHSGGAGGAGGYGKLTTGGGGGGGGGGYYGGGGGGGGGGFYSDPGPGAGGGGGSSYIEPSVKRFRLWRGWKTATGDGLVVIGWQ